MTPEEALREIGSLAAGARVTARLAGGPASDSFAIARGQDRWVLRIDRPAAVRLGLDRAAEARVLAKANRAGLAPRLEYIDVEAGVQLVRWVAGRAWRTADALEPDNILRIGALLRRLHDTGPAGIPLDLTTRVAAYADTAGGADARAAADWIRGVLGDVGPSPVGACLCHNDPIAANVIDGDTLTLIDWEYAADGDPFFDLAIVAEQHDYSDDAARLLLDAWEAGSGESHARRLARWRAIYRRLVPLWSAAAGNG